MESNEKHKRPDRKEKLLKRSRTTERIIKCKLRSHLKLNNDDKDKLINLIQKLVYKYSQRIFNTTLLINLMIRDVCKNNETNLQDIPDITNDTFIRQVMLGTDKAQKPIQFVTTYFNKYPELFYNTNDRDTYDKNIYCYGSQMLGTNIKNHFVTNFEHFLRRYLKSLELKNVQQKFYIINDLYGLKTANKNIIENNFEQPKTITDKDIENNKNTKKVVENKEKIIKKEKKTKELIEECNKHISFLKQFLELKDKVITEKWLKGNYLTILKFFVYINRHLEKLNEKLELHNSFKLINILPISRIKTHFITFDKCGLECLAKNSKIEDYEWIDLEKLIDNKNLRITKDWKFSGTIQTDGTQLCIHYIKELEEKKTKKKKIVYDNKEISETDRVIAFDPGRTNILYGVEKTSDGNYKTYKLTRRQYYNDSGVYKVKRKTEKRNLKHKDILESLSINSPKSISLENFHKYLEVIKNNKNTLFEEYTNPLWSNQRFELYCKKRQVLSKFFNSLKNRKDKRNLVIAYGSANFSSNGKGEVSVPTTTVFKTCKSMYQTNLVDEFRTSKLSYKDHTLLNLVGKRSLELNEKGEVEYKSLRGLLWYCSTNGCSNFVNRDLNAAINILNLSKCEERPYIFKRQKNNSLRKQKIVKTIDRE